ncbi:MAG: DEAD/DEAH box helicase [Candidatus Falkowbacteria bacterium]|nr:MAG: DEAD/DEAH box helicase [Candidatus Falkowbacteria bacterium]
MTKNVDAKRQAVASSVKEEQSFADLGISNSILEILKKLNLEIPTPIQAKTIPAAISGQDIIGIAQTGTGKTFAFGIPMLERLGKLKGQGLVIAPTRELALQVDESIKKLGQPLGLRTAVLIGGESLDRQLFHLRKKPHIVVATPGRLIDHLKRHTFKLDQVNTLVLDEADMMLDMGFAPQIKEILDQMPVNRQTMLFSATMPAAIVKIAASYMKLPISIEVAPQGTTAAQIDQEIFIIRGDERFEHLVKVLAAYSGSVLVFVRTKHGVKTLTMKLKALGQRATEIHSNLSLSRRRAALDAFKSQRERILVATDVAARGLDVNGIELVVNYNLPDNSEDYVHRIGRTARAGKSGKAITFATIDERKEIMAIEKLINKSIKRTEFAKISTPQFSHPKISADQSRKKSFTAKPFRSSVSSKPFRSSATGGAQQFRSRGVEAKPFRPKLSASAAARRSHPNAGSGRPMANRRPTGQPFFGKAVAPKFKRSR